MIDNTLINAQSEIIIILCLLKHYRKIIQDTVIIF